MARSKWEGAMLRREGEEEERGRRRGEGGITVAIIMALVIASSRTCFSSTSLRLSHSSSIGSSHAMSLITFIPWIISLSSFTLASADFILSPSSFMIFMKITASAKKTKKSPPSAIHVASFTCNRRKRR